MEGLVYEATARQAVFHAAPEMYKLFGGAMGGGKTFALCAESTALSIDYPGNRGYVCRDTYASFQRTTGIVLEDLLLRSGQVARHNQSRKFYTLKNGSTIFYGGLGDDLKQIDRLKSMELGFFAIDEASETSEAFFLMLASRLRIRLPGIRYFGLLASNPDPGWLKRRFIDQKLPNHLFVPALPKDNPCLAPGYVERLREVFPEDWQKRLIEGDWSAFEGLNSVFPFGAVQLAMKQSPTRHKPVELGVDVARFGDDESSITLRKGDGVEMLWTCRGADLMTTTGQVALAIKEHKPSDVKVDADGLGAGVVDRLRELGKEVSEIHGGGRANDPERFANRKAEIYWGFRERLLACEVALPNDLELASQLASCSYKVRSSGQIEITPKDEMKRQGVRSPDRAESVIYAFAAPGIGPRIRSL